MTAQPLSLPNLLGRAWWLVLLRALAAIVFGVAALLWPHLTLVTLALLYALFALGDGVFALGAALHGGGLAPRWWLVLVGLASLAAGAFALAWPGITAILLVMLIGASAVTRGLLEIRRHGQAVAVCLPR